jgi:outer membrane receptor protein involved in Fe transport
VSGRRLQGFTVIDARVSLKGERWRLSAFGKNITDESYVLQQINSNNYYNQRARYGLEFSLKFGGEAD